MSKSHPQIGTIEIRAPKVLLRLLAGWLEDDLRIHYVEPAMSPTMQDEVRWPRPRPMAADCGPCELCARLDCFMHPTSEATEVPTVTPVKKEKK